MPNGELIFLVWNDFVGISRTRGVPVVEYERRRTHGLGWALAGQALTPNALPALLDATLDAFERDPPAKRWFSPTMLEAYTALKRREAEAFVESTPGHMCERYALAYRPGRHRSFGRRTSRPECDDAGPQPSSPRRRTRSEDAPCDAARSMPYHSKAT